MIETGGGHERSCDRPLLAMLAHLSPAMPWEKAPLLLLPENLRAQLLSYIEFGTPPGPLLTAILSNDLLGFLDQSRQQPGMLNKVLQVLDDAPMEAWGSARAVRDWIARGGMRGSRRHGRVQ